MVRIYDTPLSPEQMLAYNQFLKESKRGMDETDYDLRGFFRDGNSFDAAGHGADWYKKPNHPTFSNESQYHGTDGLLGGIWAGSQFIPSQHNLNVHGTRGIAQELLRSGQGVSLGGPGILEALIREMGL